MVLALFTFCVTVQCLTVTGKNPFQIGFADGIFAFKPAFYYGQRSECADLLNSYLSVQIFRHTVFHHTLWLALNQRESVGGEVIGDVVS